jgi:hypothetical protein
MTTEQKMVVGALNLATGGEESAGFGEQKGQYMEAKAYFNKDKTYITLVLPNNIRVRKHVNFYKHLLEMPYVSVKKAEVGQ